MAIAVAQSKIAWSNGVASYAISFDATPTAGRTIVVCTSWYPDSDTTISVTDNQGNSYSQVENFFNSPVRTTMHYAANIAASGTFTVTINPSGASDDIAVIILELSGTTASPLSTHTNGTGTSTAVASGNITPGANNAILIGSMTHGGSDRTITEAGGWTLIREHEGGSADMPLAAAYKIQTTATSEGASWTLGTGAVVWAACVASFLPAASTSPIYAVVRGSSSVRGVSSARGALSARASGFAIDRGGVRGKYATASRVAACGSMVGAVRGRYSMHVTAAGESTARGLARGRAAITVIDRASSALYGRPIATGSVVVRAIATAAAMSGAQARGAIQSTFQGGAISYGYLSVLAGTSSLYVRVSAGGLTLAAVTGRAQLAARVSGVASDYGRLSARGIVAARATGTARLRASARAPGRIAAILSAWAVARASARGSGALHHTAAGTAALYAYLDVPATSPPMYARLVAAAVLYAAVQGRAQAVAWLAGAAWDISGVTASGGVSVRVVSASIGHGSTRGLGSAQAHAAGTSYAITVPDGVGRVNAIDAGGAALYGYATQSVPMAAIDLTLAARDALLTVSNTDRDLILSARDAGLTVRDR